MVRFRWPTAVRRRLQWRRGLGFWTTTALIAVGLVFVLPATASHPEASLPGSNFEIDVDANLKVDDPAPSIDWASVAEARQNDLATGPDDDSYAGGAKEDDVCPGTTTGSIPNNKSDLLTFGAYVEPEASGPGFLNLFWTRVQEPSGTTLMDFELNQSSTLCANGVNPVRTVGDLLIEYRIEQGGATATLRVRQWNGSAWGAAQDLSAVGAATGTINSSPIPAADSDGLSSSDPLSPRTFGEAQLDLDFILDKTKCQSFGSAFLKSRASDSFTSQLKDFIKPVSVNIVNCATVIIRKVTDPPSDPSITRFGYTKSFGTDPASENTFTLGHGENKTFNNNVLFGSGYTVVEDNLPEGWDFVSIDCSASTGVAPAINGATVTFTIDSPGDILDCTYTNQARGVIVVVKITDDGFGPFDFTSNTLSPSPFTLTTTAPGEAGKDSRTFADLKPGTYDVAEIVPPGWTLVSSSCSDASDPGAIHLSAKESITCTFHDARQKGAILITKTRKHAAGGPGNQPHPGVVFTVSGGSLAASVQVTTGDNGTACVDGLVLSSFVGDYTVAETIPSGYHAAGDTSKTVSVTAEATCASGPKADVSFHNTPLTNVTVSVDSQVDGGTASTITCDALPPKATEANGDGSLTLIDLEPTTVNCTIVIDP